MEDIRELFRKIPFICRIQGEYYAFGSPLFYSIHGSSPLDCRSPLLCGSTEIPLDQQNSQFHIDFT